MESMVRVRFAPSPTGYLHVGGARTALFNYLFARHHQGTMVLRIEDTDQKRFQKGAMDEIFQSLKWMRLDWDEGPDTEGEYGPYIQSERKEIYLQHADQLMSTGKAYQCFCTPERLAKLRQKQQNTKMKIGSGYDRHCMDLSPESIKQKLDSGTPYVIRLKIPELRTIEFEDSIRGKIVYQSDILDDFVLLKSDGFPTYHLANVIDDHYMKISHVMRGDEWIASTPRHILIYESFGWEPPQFAHLPVILAQDGGKLSKRKGAASVLDYKSAGYLPDALVNFLALLGWSPGQDREIMTREELISLFNLKKVSPKASVFDEKKLEWMNGHYLRESSVDSLFDMVVERWLEMGLFNNRSLSDESYGKTIIGLMKARSKRIHEIAESSVYFFRDPDRYEDKLAKKYFKAAHIDVLKVLVDKLERVSSFSHEFLEAVFRGLAESENISPGKLIHPARLAVSGVGHGPGLFELLEVLGKETTIRRLNKAIEWVKRKEINQHGAS
jgi:glutamyl-tRNA synthetase